MSYILTFDLAKAVDVNQGRIFVKQFNHKQRKKSFFYEFNSIGQC